MKNSHRTIRFAPLAKLRQPVRRIVSEDGDTFEFSPGPLVSPPLGDAGIRDTDPPPWVTAIILAAMAIGILSLMAVMLWGAK